MAAMGGAFTGPGVAGGGPLALANAPEQKMTAMQKLGNRPLNFTGIAANSPVFFQATYLLELSYPSQFLHKYR